MDSRVISERAAGFALALALLAHPAIAQERAVEGVVRSATGAIEDAVVVLIPASARAVAARPAAAVIDQTQLRFEPAAVAIAPGATVTFLNSDPILHNVFSPSRRGEGFDLGTYPRTESRSHTFSRAGTYVILCHVHPEMAAYVVVAESPFTAVTDDQGHFRIADVPAGSYRLQVWHRAPAPRLEQPLTVPARGLRGVEVDLRSARVSVPASTD